MSVRWRAQPHGAELRPSLRAMTRQDIDAVMALETAVYAFPWTRGNFVDSLVAGHMADVLREGAQARLIGYFVALPGVEEMHLLNITIAPACQRQGHCRRLLDELVERCRRRGAHRLWLETRESNLGARAAYARLGFAQEGVRPGYYPAAGGQRESAVLMSLRIDAQARPDDALG